MKHSLTLFALIATFFIPSIAQTPSDYSLVKGFGGAGTDIGYAVATDMDSNIIVTGQFKATCDFGGQSLTSNGLQDIFIAKYSASGNLIWVKQIGGGANDKGKGVCTDPSNNIYITGDFNNDLTIDGTVSITNAGLNDIILAKYDPNGTILWAKSMGGIDADFGESVAASPLGGVVVTGIFRSSSTFGSINLSSTGQEDIFLVRVASDGIVTWAKKAGSSSGDNGLDVTVDGTGNIYSTGFFTGNASFGTLSISTSGQRDAFLAKYDDNGTAVWVKKGSSSSNAYELSFGVATDKNGNAIICGFFYGGTTLSFGTINLTNQGQYDIFIVKYNSAGTVKWAKSYGASGYDYAYDVETDFNGNVVLTGGFDNTVNFGGISKTSSKPDVEDLFILKLDSSGNSSWVMTAGSSFSSLNYTWGEGLTIDRLGNVITTGSIVGKPSFGSFSLASYEAINSILPDGEYGDDVFIAKIFQNVPVTQNVTITPTATNVSCFGGNDGAISVAVSNGTSPYTYIWSTGSTNSSISGLSQETYTVTVTDNASATNSASFSITQPTDITVLSNYTNIKCFGGNDGKVDVNVTGGTQPYSYLWKDGAGSTIGTADSVSNLLPGLYSVTITDANSCTKFSEDSLTQPAELQLTTVVSKASSQTTCDGDIDLTVTGGVSPFIYLWGNGKNTQDVADLCTGNHSVTVTDANNCTKNGLFFVDFLIGIKENQNSGNNPFIVKNNQNGEILIFTTDKTISYRVTIINTTGQKISDTQEIISSEPGIVKLPNPISNGIYFLIIRSNSRFVVSKILVDIP